LDLAEDCHGAYRGAAPTVRRLFVQAFLERLYAGDDEVHGDLAEPFRTLLSEEVLTDGCVVARHWGGRDVSPRCTGVNAAGRPRGRLCT
jgi:hypothetical protein